MKRKASFLECFVPPEGQQLRAAVLTTFDLDLQYLERTLLPTILGVEDADGDPDSASDARASMFALEMRRRLRDNHVAVLTDARRHDWSQNKRYQTYDLLFARTWPAFHPKLYVLAFDRVFRLVVASANITESGFHRNLEVFWKASSDTGERFGNTAQQALAFLRGVAKREWPTSRTLDQTLNELGRRAPRGGGGPDLLHTLDRSLIQQWKVPDHLDELHVVSPTFDQAGELPALRSLAPGKLAIYVREERVDGKPRFRLPVSKAALKRSRATALVIEPHWIAGAPRNDQPPAPRPLHAKLYAARSGKKGWALLGSANCSATALLSPHDRRNAEAVISLHGSWREISALLPPVSQEIDASRLDTSLADEDAIEGQGWIPFVTLAEYDAESRQLTLDFEKERTAIARWSIHYGSSVIAFGGRGPFPRRRTTEIQLGENTTIELREGAHLALLAISIHQKPLLPLIPGMDSLDYESILEFLAHGVTNLTQFSKQVMERVKLSRREDRGDSVPFMDQLSRLTKALERMRKRAGAPLNSVAEAKALFHGDLGIAHVVAGLRGDGTLDPDIRRFALLELGSMLTSVRFVGSRDAVRHALHERNRIGGIIAQSTSGCGRIRALYLSQGATGWRR